MKNGGQIPWDVTPICETSQISCLMGRLHTKGRFGEPFKGLIIPFGSLVEYYTIESINLESLTWIVPWIRSVRGENLER